MRLRATCALLGLLLFTVFDASGEITQVHNLSQQQAYVDLLFGEAWLPISAPAFLFSGVYTLSQNVTKPSH